MDGVCTRQNFPARLNRNRLWLLCAALCATAAWLIGCTTFPMPDRARKADLAKTETVDPKQEETLSAVEEFLARTQHYSVKPDSTINKTIASKELSKNAHEPLSIHLPETTAKTAATPAPAEVPATSERADQPVVNAKVAVTPSVTSKPPLAIPALQEVSIRKVGGDDESISGAAAKSSMVNAPLDTQSTDEALWERLLKELGAQQEGKQDVDGEWRLRLAQLAADRVADARQVSKSLPQDAQNVLSAYVDAGAAIRDLARNPLMESDEAVSRVGKLQSLIRERSDPKVSSISFCRKVSTFGAYEAMSKDDFVAGRSTQTIVYCEVDCLRSDKTADGGFQARLATRLEILTTDGKSVWQREEPEITDTCRRERRDFFIAQRITVPATLAAGNYVLKVSVEDKIANRAGEAIHEFSIVNPLSVAKTGS